MWKEIAEYENIYVINEYGIIKNLKTNHILKSFISKSGYLKVHLWKENKEKNKYVHRLVAETFIEKLENNLVVNHIDGNKLNNYYLNLEWVTSGINNKKAYDIGLKIVTNTMMEMFSKAGIAKRKKVFQYNIENEKIHEYESISQAAKENGYSISSISRCCRGEQFSYHNYIWSFENIERKKPI